MLRGGYGIFYGGNEMQDLESFVSLQFPWVVSESPSRNVNNPNYLTLANPFPAAPNLTNNVITAFGMQMRHGSPYQQSWNLTAERDLGRSSALEIGYVSQRNPWDKMSNLNQPYRSAATYSNGSLSTRHSRSRGPNSAPRSRSAVRLTLLVHHDLSAKGGDDVIGQIRRRREPPASDGWDCSWATRKPPQGNWRETKLSRSCYARSRRARGSIASQGPPRKAEARVRVRRNVHCDR